MATKGWSRVPRLSLQCYSRTLSLSLIILKQSQQTQPYSFYSLSHNFKLGETILKQSHKVQPYSLKHFNNSMKRKHFDVTTHTTIIRFLPLHLNSEQIIVPLTTTTRIVNWLLTPSKNATQGGHCCVAARCCTFYIEKL